MTTPNPDAEVIEKLACELFEVIHPSPMALEIAQAVLAREQAAVNAAIKEVSRGLKNAFEVLASQSFDHPTSCLCTHCQVREESRAILAKLK